MRQAELKVTSGKHAGSVIPLPEGKFLVGREEDCHLRPNSDLVSRHHCVFTVDEFAVRIRDLGSTNGTLVNGDRIRGGVMLNAGDIVSIGKIEFEVVLREGGQDTDTQMAIASDTQIARPPQPAHAAHADDAEGAAVTESSDLTQIPAGAPPGGDTQYLQQPAAINPAAAYPPGLPGMAYPQQMMPPYGYGGYPPMPYPPQPMAYPMPGMYAPPGGPLPEEASPAAETSSVAQIPVRLPNPEETGVKETPKAPAGEGGAAPSSSSASKESSTSSVADIIKKYRNRRPGS